MSVQENSAQGTTATNIIENNPFITQGVYASLFEKITLNPASSLINIDPFQNRATRYTVPYLQVENMDVNRSLIFQISKTKIYSLEA